MTTDQNTARATSQANADTPAGPPTGTPTGAATLQAYDAHARPLGAVLDSITDWRAPSPCEGWTAADVVGHIIETERDFFTRHELDLGPAPDVSADPAAAWHTHDDAVRRVLGDDDVAGRAIEGFFGPSTVAALFLQVYGFDLLVHRWDVARSGGRDERFTDSELETIETAIAGFGEHMYAEGICKPALDVPADADRQTRVLAAMGRTA